MIITTARKPSQKTRTFCKRLGKFTGWEYVTRGKSSLSNFDDGNLLLVGESRGNPANFNFFLNGECILSIRANISAETDISPGREPVIEGGSALASALCNATGFNTGGDSDRIIRVSEERIEFMHKGVACIVLKVIGIRGRGFA